MVLQACVLCLRCHVCCMLSMTQHRVSCAYFLIGQQSDLKIPTTIFRTSHKDSFYNIGNTAADGVCCWFQGGLSINYSDNYYHLSQRHPDVPRLTQQHYEAMALFNEIASSDALRMDAMLQPGDIQLLNNHTQLHTRAEFEDFPVSPCAAHLCCILR